MNFEIIVIDGIERNLMKTYYNVILTRISESVDK